MKYYLCLSENNEYSLTFILYFKILLFFVLLLKLLCVGIKEWDDVERVASSQYHVLGLSASVLKPDSRGKILSVSFLKGHLCITIMDCSIISLAITLLKPEFKAKKVTFRIFLRIQCLRNVDILEFRPKILLFLLIKGNDSTN